MIKRYSVVRIYPMNHIKTGPYWLVSARSKKRNVNERKTFSSKKLAENSNPMTSMRIFIRRMKRQNCYAMLPSTANL